MLYPFFYLRYFVYEVQTRNIFPLSPKDGARDAPFLQHVLWAPNNQLTSPAAALKFGTIHPSSTINSKSISQAIAFVYENDLYYKPKVQNDLVCRITNTGNCFSFLHCVCVVLIGQTIWICFYRY